MKLDTGTFGRPYMIRETDDGPTISFKLLNNDGTQPAPDDFSRDMTFDLYRESELSVVMQNEYAEYDPERSIVTLYPKEAYRQAGLYLLELNIVSNRTGQRETAPFNDRVIIQCLPRLVPR